MNIISKEHFMNRPNGIVYSDYDGSNVGELKIKLDNIDDGHFLFICFSDLVNGVSFDQDMDVFESFDEIRGSFSVNLRDFINIDHFDDDRGFIIWKYEDMSLFSEAFVDAVSEYRSRRLK